VTRRLTTPLNDPARAILVSVSRGDVLGQLDAEPRQVSKVPAGQDLDHSAVVDLGTSRFRKARQGDELPGGGVIR
jgi:hypothetical protein